MEVKFNKLMLPCLRPVVSQVQTREETLELRLPDGMPDIGKVLGCWGQVLLRGKEWNEGFASASAGIMVWTLYAPEDGTEPRVVEGWIPVQGRWELSEESRDGGLTVQPWLSSLDCRNVSVRKLMLRGEVSIMGSAMKPWKAELAVPAELPEDVQVLKKTYPMELPMEQGEKQVLLEENLPLPGGNEPVHRVVGYRMVPGITERRIMANRLLFKGKAMFHLIYMSEEGTLHTWDTELPFSQYTELDKDYGSNAKAWVLPVLTAAEVDIAEGNLQVKVGIAAQYTIFDQSMVEVTEDAYSPRRQLNLERDALYLPSRLDSQMLTVPVEGTADGEFSKILDSTYVVQQPYFSEVENGQSLVARGKSQIMYRDGENQLCSDTVGWGGQTDFPMDPNTRAELWFLPERNMDWMAQGDGASVQGECSVLAQIYNGSPLPMVTGMEMGELAEPEPNRPSVILRRAGESLWDIAKMTGSTVADIMEANQLNCEPEMGKMLLIPVK